MWQTVLRRGQLRGVGPYAEWIRRQRQLQSVCRRLLLAEDGGLPSLAPFLPHSTGSLTSVSTFVQEMRVTPCRQDALVYCLGTLLPCLALESLPYAVYVW